MAPIETTVLEAIPPRVKMSSYKFPSMMEPSPYLRSEFLNFVSYVLVFPSTGLGTATSGRTSTTVVFPGGTGNNLGGCGRPAVIAILTTTATAVASIHDKIGAASIELKEDVLCG
jgi:hypothetical protein